jgi:hypothetical protein
VAAATICHSWPDGNSTEISVEVDESYPDALDQAVVEVLRMWREVAVGE